MNPLDSLQLVLITLAICMANFILGSIRRILIDIRDDRRKTIKENEEAGRRANKTLTNEELRSRGLL